MGDSRTERDVEGTPGDLSPGDLWHRIVSSYTFAQNQGAVYKTNTNTELLKDGTLGIPFILQVAEALREKPTSNQKRGEPKEPWVNPFLPYDEALWVTHLSDTHTLLLNKFNIVPHHVLVVTRAFEQQNDLLKLEDFEAAWQVLQSMPGGGLAYYNCGPSSGASQPHKHVQVVPLPLAEKLDQPVPLFAAMSNTQEAQKAATGAVFEIKSFPFRSYGSCLPQGTNAAQLVQIYNGMVVAAFGKASLDVGHFKDDQSYNLILTLHHMMLVPRSSESWGPVSLNAMGFAGSFFVRSMEELSCIKQAGGAKILLAVGLPW